MAEASGPRHPQFWWPQAGPVAQAELRALGTELVQPLHLGLRVPWLAGDAVRMGKGGAWRVGGLPAAEPGDGWSADSEGCMCLGRS